MSDPRFARLKTDPRFRRIKKDKNKVVVDERFKDIFHSKDKKKGKGGKGTPTCRCSHCVKLMPGDDQRVLTSTGGPLRTITSRKICEGSTVLRTKMMPS